MYDFVCMDVDMHVLPLPRIPLCLCMYMHSAYMQDYVCMKESLHGDGFVCLICQTKDLIAHLTC